MIINTLTVDSFQEFFDCICELADYEQLPIPDEAVRKRLFDDAFSDTPKYFASVFFEDNKIDVIGYCITFFSYSSFLAKPTLYLEDIYIKPKHRSQGYGELVLNHLVDVAKANNCGRMEWQALDWNTRAHDFYIRFGATKLDNWVNFRMTL